MRYGFLTLAALVAAILLAAYGIIRSQPEEDHHQDVKFHQRAWSVELAPDVRLARVRPPSRLGERDLAVSQDGTIRAWLEDRPSGPDTSHEHLLLEYLDSGEVYEVTGVPLEHRPFSDLTWLGDRYLVFDRWSSPHYGMHYVLDALDKRLLLATPFPDQFFLDSQKVHQQVAGTGSPPRRP